MPASHSEPQGAQQSLPAGKAALYHILCILQVVPH